MTNMNDMINYWEEPIPTETEVNEIPFEDIDWDNWLEV